MAIATSGYYGPKYPLIVIDDKNTNYPNAANNIKKITVEEWQDLLHHTHPLAEILDAEGIRLGDAGSSDVSLEEFNNLKNTVEAQNSLITNLQAEIAQLQTTITEMASRGGIEIGDWDVTQPGIQGPDGKTIG